MPWLLKPTKDVEDNENIGEPSTGCDPVVSEWGNLGSRNRTDAPDLSGCMGIRGTETSKYPEEKKSMRFR